ncbi:MAG: hypothetical protein ACYT04_89155, partial [Nostoc sp.]
MINIRDGEYLKTEIQDMLAAQEMVVIAENIPQLDVPQEENIKQFIEALATRSHGYTDKTHLRGLKTIDSSLVHAGGLCLCSSVLLRRSKLR